MDILLLTVGIVLVIINLLLWYSLGRLSDSLEAWRLEAHEVSGNLAKVLEAWERLEEKYEKYKRWLN